MTPPTPSTDTANKPVETVRLGAIVAAIWRNEAEDGRVRFNATVERIYMDDADNWKSTNSFGRDDLLVLAKVCDQAHSRIHDLLSAERESARDGQKSKPTKDAAGRKAAANGR